MHRIAIECEGFPFRIYWRSSPWKSPGHYAWAYCDDIWPFQAATGRYTLYRTAS